MKIFLRRVRRRFPTGKDELVMQICGAQKPIHGEIVFLESRPVCQLLYWRKDATEFEMTTLECPSLVRDRVRGIRGIRE